MKLTVHERLVVLSSRLKGVALEVHGQAEIVREPEIRHTAVVRLTGQLEKLDQIRADLAATIEDAKG